MFWLFHGFRFLWNGYFYLLYTALWLSLVWFRDKKILVGVKIHTCWHPADGGPSLECLMLTRMVGLDCCASYRQGASHICAHLYQTQRADNPGLEQVCVCCCPPMSPPPSVEVCNTTQRVRVGVSFTTVSFHLSFLASSGDPHRFLLAASLGANQPPQLSSQSFIQILMVHIVESTPSNMLCCAFCVFLAQLLSSSGVCWCFICTLFL